MNPFELYGELTKQWFALATALMTGANPGRESGRSMPMSPFGMLPQASLWPWPWMQTAATPAMPFFPFMNPFMSQSAPFTAFFPFAAPTMQPAPMQPFTPLSWPMLPWSAWQPSAASQLPLPFMSATSSANWPWTFFGAMFAPFQFAAPATAGPADIFDQMMTSYRTASGYAVAAIVAPFGAKDVDRPTRSPSSSPETGRTRH